MKLSFVIPAYNEENGVGACIDAIKKDVQGLPYETEIIVVDNASTDRTAAVAGSYPGVKVVHEKEKGIVHARRAGFLASTGDIVANIDSDTHILPGWSKKVMAAFAKDKKLVAISGPFIYYDAPWEVRFFTRLFYYLGYGFYLINRFVLHVGSMLQGGNFAVRRSAMIAIGGFDVNLKFYGEDTDIARRLTKVGKVKFDFGLPADSSGRRLAKEGGIRIAFRYAINYFWITFFKKPFTDDYKDIRPEDGKKKPGMLKEEDGGKK
jgi:glycosyltransferase involved in cell wall biosynthesis